jgi:hypothetical protein
MSKKLKTVDIKGKAYVMVNERIAYFRQLYPQGTIITELLSSVDGTHTFKATAINDGVILATGHASEKDGSTFINKTSAIENAETSAVGRCLGILGIGIDASIATAEEVGNAVAQQEAKPAKKAPSKNIDAVKKDMAKAHQEGELKQFFFTLDPDTQDVLREYANDLRSS